MPIKLNKNLETADLLPIAVTEIKAMKDFYVNTLSDGSPMGDDDATSCWVSTAEINALVNDNIVNGKTPNGIRIYYGRHPESTKLALGYEYINMHNVILVATYDSNTANPQTETSQDLVNWDTSTGEEANSVSYNSSYKGMGGDAIPLCPPRC